jgi:hypothetical protein
MGYNEFEVLVLAKGPEEVAERLRAGVLPEEDLHAAVRDVLFEPIKDWKRWRKISKEHIAAKCGCDPGDVQFEKIIADTFTAEEWSKLKQLVKLYPGQVEPFWVVASAPDGCNRRYTKASVKVTFAGRSFVREVAL